ncbi:MAG: hypothetical protein E7515_07195 [Ruminococcaceae bacterium]|nr:hypothetical protein [Oscillospiraceae bacterium]
MSKEIKRIIRKRILLSACFIITVAVLLILFFDWTVNTDSPTDAMYYIYIVLPFSVMLLINALLSDFVFFKALLNNRGEIEKYGEVKKAYTKSQKTFITVKRILCLAFVLFILLGRSFGIMKDSNNNRYIKLSEKRITELCNAEESVSNDMNLEYSFLWYNSGCISNLKKYNYGDSFASKTVVFMKGVPNWYVKRYFKKEVHFISEGTRFYNHSTDLKTTEKNGVSFFYTIDDDLTNMELIAFNRHSLVQISVGGPEGSDLTVDEEKIIDYAYGFFR